MFRCVRFICLKTISVKKMKVTLVLRFCFTNLSSVGVKRHRNLETSFGRQMKLKSLSCFITTNTRRTKRNLWSRQNANGKITPGTFCVQINHNAQLFSYYTPCLYSQVKNLRKNRKTVYSRNARLWNW